MGREKSYESIRAIQTKLDAYYKRATWMRDCAFSRRLMVG